MTSDDGLEVFQDLKLRGPEQQRSALRQALLSHAAAPWRHAGDKEKELGESELEVITFERAEGEGVDAAGLLLWWHSDGYEVTNIVPLQLRELSFRRYNAVLQDFIQRVAKAASQDAGFSIETTTPRQSISDWLSPEIADALRSFSRLANKSTGSSHPSDRKRWFNFLIKAHKNKRTMDATRLARWLVEVEGWPEDKADDLAIQYEFALDLLTEYDGCSSSC